MKDAIKSENKWVPSSRTNSAHVSAKTSTPFRSNTGELTERGDIKVQQRWQSNNKIRKISRMIFDHFRRRINNRKSIESIENDRESDQLKFEEPEEEEKPSEWSQTGQKI